MLKRLFGLRQNDNLKRSRSSRPRVEWMEPRTLLSLPTVTGLSPTIAPAAGGTLVTITGTGFTGATAVDFGTTAATNVTVVNNTTITADSPAVAGDVDVTVTTPAILSADQFTIAVDPPTVASLARLGFHMQQTSLVLKFSSALDATTAENVNNYQIMTTGGVVAIRSAVYDPASLTVTLFPAQRLSLHTVNQLTINGAPPNGLTGATGVPLAGQGNVSGTNYALMFSGDILAGPAPVMLSTAPKKFAAAEKVFAAAEKKYAAEPKKLAAEQKSLGAAAKRFAAAEKKLAAQLPNVKGPSTSAVDALSGLGELTARSKAV
jgi:IPT/TIG domain